MPKSLKSATKIKSADDLFGAPEPKGRAPLKVAPRVSSAEAGYTARDIEVLEGLEPVRRRPGMYIGGTDEKALHHLFAEVIDNAMDEALAGHADFIDVELGADGFLTVTDNGRGIPVDPHPKFPKKSALEVIICTLHSGGKAPFKPQRLFKMARSKAYLFGGVKIRWHCDPALLKGVDDVPAEAEFHFVGGLKDYLAAAVHADTLVHPDIFSGKSGRVGAHGACEWAVAWTADADGFLSSYCNTVPTQDGGTHESGMRSALL